MVPKLKIALMAGGNSSEREVSLGSASMIYEAFDKSRYDVFFIDVNQTRWVCTSPQQYAGEVDRNDFSLVTKAGARVKFDYAFIVIHGSPGEDGMLQGYLDMMDVPYSSCGMVSTVLTFDKNACKRVVEAEGVRVARQLRFTAGDKWDPAEIVSRLGLPLIVKPNASGSSFGVSKVNDTGELKAAFANAFAESDTVLAEEFIAGREFGCGLIIGREREIILPITEIVSKNEFFDYQAKYTPGFSEEITPAPIDEEIAGKIRDLAARAYRACGCRGLVRVDFIVPEDRDPVMIEINSVPGMSAGSIIPKQLEAAGIPLREMIDFVISETYRKEDVGNRR